MRVVRCVGLKWIKDKRGEIRIEKKMELDVLVITAHNISD